MYYPKLDASLPEKDPVNIKPHHRVIQISKEIYYPRVDTSLAEKDPVNIKTRI